VLKASKCDNAYPECSNCEKAGVSCLKAPDAEAHAINNSYTRALEDHVAQLESKINSLQAQIHAPMTPNQVVESAGTSMSHNVADIVGMLSTGHAEAPSYIGSSSGLALASNLGDMVKATVWNKALWIAASGADDQERPMEGGRVLGESPTRRITISELRNNAADVPPDQMGKRMIEAFLVHIHPRYPFLVPSNIWHFHEQRHVLSSGDAPSQEDHLKLFVLYMVYAIGALNLRLTQQSYNETPPEKFYIAALQHVSGAREASSIHNIEAMLLLVLYHMRSESNYGLWHMAGLAMRTCIDLGLHREASTRHLPPTTQQLRRRLFWSLYFVEGVLSSTLGRPISLSDTDIDQPLPLSIGDDEPTGPSARVEIRPVPGREAHPYTKMSQAILLFQLRRLESRIQRCIYRVDRETSTLLPELYPLYTELETWRANVPTGMKESEMHRPLLSYHRLMCLLIRPFLDMLNPADLYFQQCVTSAGQICQIHQRLHRSSQYGHSSVAVHTIFVAGVTLLYCLWLHKQTVWSFSVSNSVRACSCVISIMAERAPWVRRYRDVYEGLVEATMDALESSEDATASAFGRMSADFSLEGLDILDDAAYNMAKQIIGWAE